MIKWGQGKIISLDIDDGFVAATQLLRKQKQVYLISHTIVSNLKELLKKPSFKGAGVIVNLPAQVVLFRSFHLPASLSKSKNKQKDIVAFLSRQNLPFKLQECYWGTFALNSNFNLIAAKKEVVEKYINQVQELGLSVLGVSASLVALYNVLIYTYPEREKDKFALLNIRTASSDLLIYEAKRLWVYPLSMGKRDLNDNAQDLTRFSIEVQSIFNAHYLQNPSVMQKPPNHFYLSGQACSKELASSLKSVLGDFEIMPLEPFKRIGILKKEPLASQQELALSLGLGLTYLKAALCLKTNLIEDKVGKEQFSSILNSLKKISLYVMIAAIACLLFWNLKLIKGLKAQLSIYKDTQFQISSMLPDIKAAKEEKEKLQKLKDFFAKKLSQQRLYLKALAAISESRPQPIVIKEFDAEVKDAILEVSLSGSAAAYQDINDFLARLKKNEDLKEVKVLASTFSTLEAQAKGIDFKLRFDVRDAKIKPEEAGVMPAKRNPKEAVKPEKKDGGK